MKSQMKTFMTKVLDIQMTIRGKSDFTKVSSAEDILLLHVIDGRSHCTTCTVGILRSRNHPIRFNQVSDYCRRFRLEGNLTEANTLNIGIGRFSIGAGCPLKSTKNSICDEPNNGLRTSYKRHHSTETRRSTGGGRAFRVIRQRSARSARFGTLRAVSATRTVGRKMMRACEAILTGLCTREQV